MKTKLIFITALILSKAAFGVDNIVTPVDKGFLPKIPPVPLCAIEKVYTCHAYTQGNEATHSFTLVKKANLVQVALYKGENVYGNSHLSFVSQQSGVDSVQYTYSLSNGGELIISETQFFGRGGGRGGRGGPDSIVGTFKDALLKVNGTEIDFVCH